MRPQRREICFVCYGSHGRLRNVGIRRCPASRQCVPQFSCCIRQQSAHSPYIDSRLITRDNEASVVSNVRRFEADAQ